MIYIYINLMVNTNPKSIIDTHTQTHTYTKKGIQTTVKILIK